MKQEGWKHLFRSLLLLTGFCMIAVLCRKPDQELFLSVDTVSLQNMEREDTVTLLKRAFYSEPISDALKERITGVSFPPEECSEIRYEDLCHIHVLHFNFDHEIQRGELICNRIIAEDLLEIFWELFEEEYPIERIGLMEEYNGDDISSMEDNNTSCFNYRVVDGTSSLSKHALGFAIDINPFYNPYVIYNRDGNGETYISPKGSEVYADRSLDFPYKIDESDLCYRLFAEHGFIWGGNWNSSKDYQHFQKVVDSSGPCGLKTESPQQAAGIFLFRL